MNKFLSVVIGMALVAASASSFATSLETPTVSGSVGVDSRYDFRGQRYSDDAALGASLEANNVGIHGLYVYGDFNKTGDTMPFNEHQQVRSAVGVGYTVVANDKLTLDVGANHVYNAPEFNGKEYSEVSVKATYSVLFAKVAQGVGQDKNTYAKVGVNLPVTNALNVGAAVSAYHYNTSAANRYNNSEVFASYDVTNQLKVYGKYSFGGKKDCNLALTNYGTVGVSYNF